MLKNLNKIQNIANKINLCNRIPSKSTRVQNPPDKILYICYLLINLKYVLIFFCLFLFYFLLSLLPLTLTFDW